MFGVLGYMTAAVLPNRKSESNVTKPNEQVIIIQNHDLTVSDF